MQWSDTPRRSVLLALALTLSSTSVAFAQQLPPFQPDGTVFVGVTMPTARPVLGAAFGGGGSIVRFEVEYAGTRGTSPTRASVDTIGVSLMVQSRPIDRFQFYGIGGFGLYGETFEGGGGGSGEILARNIGGGAKIGLACPLRLRLDYRVFLLGDAPDVRAAWLTVGAASAM